LKSEIGKSAQQAKADGRLLSTVQLAWFWQVSRAKVDQLRKNNIIKPAFPSERNIRFHASLADSLPDFENYKKPTVRSLKGRNNQKPSPNRKEETWHL